MNLLSSNERPGTGSPAHSSMGTPLAPNPLNRSSVSRTKSVMGASVMAWDPATEFGSVARNVSAATVKNIMIMSLSDFTYFPPVIRAEGGPIQERLLFEAGLYRIALAPPPWIMLVGASGLSLRVSYHL